MMRQEYIAGLEEIRKRMIEIGQAFAAVDLTDATGMERDRRKKTAKLVGDLADRLFEDIAISAKVSADEAEAEVVDVPMIENNPLALPAPYPTKKSGKGKKPSKKPGKKPGKK